jgi:hypothetical protein
MSSCNIDFDPNESKIRNCGFYATDRQPTEYKLMGSLNSKFFLKNEDFENNSTSCSPKITKKVENLVKNKNNITQKSENNHFIQNEKSKQENSKKRHNLTNGTVLPEFSEQRISSNKNINTLMQELDKLSSSEEDSNAEFVRSSLNYELKSYSRLDMRFDLSLSDNDMSPYKRKRVFDGFIPSLSESKYFSPDSSRQNYW